MSKHEQTTKAPSIAGSISQPVSVPALTIVCHQDLNRVGERAVLHSLGRGLPVQLSRLNPDFVQTGTVLGAPLGDTRVSRSPIMFKSLSDGAVLVERGESPMRIKIDGEALDQHRKISAEQVESGTVIELGEYVVLVLHLWFDPGDLITPRFGMVGDSSAMKAARTAISRVADLGVAVLLRGESGTGKELVARAIHESGARRKRPFIGVNLSAVPPSLAATELFGAVKGAYTGAVYAQKGFFRAADSGTLFLDEVGECPGDVQTMLLRAIETSEIYPVGSDVAQRVDVRLVAATDSDLEAKAQSGDFKEPLLHRLSIYEIWLSPLRQRRDDIGRLIVHFVNQALREIGESGLPGQAASNGGFPEIPADLVARLCRYHWPGNVRQLRNVLWQLVIDSRGEKRMHPSPRLERLLSGMNDGEVKQYVTSASKIGRRPRDVSEEELVVAMQQNRWDVAAAARDLGVSRSSMYELIRRCDQLRAAEDLDAGEIQSALQETGDGVDAAAESLQVSALGLRRRMKRLGLL